jgi:hypothetical protein
MDAHPSKWCKILISMELSSDFSSTRVSEILKERALAGLQVGTLCQVDPLSILVDGGGTNRVALWNFEWASLQLFAISYLI